MRKLEEDLYIYKGVIVKKTSSGNYVARFYVNSVRGMCKVTGATQSSFMKIFNKFVKDNKGLDMEPTISYQRRNFNY